MVTGTVLGSALSVAPFNPLRTFFPQLSSHAGEINCLQKKLPQISWVLPLHSSLLSDILFYEFQPSQLCPLSSWNQSELHLDLLLHKFLTKWKDNSWNGRNICKQCKQHRINFQNRQLNIKKKQNKKTNFLVLCDLLDYSPPGTSVYKLPSFQGLISYVDWWLASEVPTFWIFHCLLWF